MTEEHDARLGGLAGSPDDSVLFGWRVPSRKRWRSLFDMLIVTTAVALATTGSAGAQHPPSEVRRVMDLSTLGACPAGVSWLLRYDPDSSRADVPVDRVITCTAFALGPHTVVTAGHCLDARHRTGSRVGSEVVLIEPGERPGDLDRRIRVVRVLHRRGPSRRVGSMYAVDIAVLSVTPAMTSWLEVARGPVAAGGDLVHGYFVDTDDLGDRLAGSCREASGGVVAERSLVLPVETSEAPATILALGLGVVPGNSGAPVLDADERVVAVVNTIFRAHRVLARTGLEPTDVLGDLPDHSGLTTLHCLPAIAGLPRRSRSRACFVRLDDEVATRRAALRQEYAETLGESTVYEAPFLRPRPRVGGRSRLPVTD